MIEEYTDKMNGISEVMDQTLCYNHYMGHQLHNVVYTHAYLPQDASAKYNFQIILPPAHA